MNDEEEDKRAQDSSWMLSGLSLDDANLIWHDNDSQFDKVLERQEPWKLNIILEHALPDGITFKSFLASDSLERVCFIKKSQSFELKRIYCWEKKIYEQNFLPRSEELLEFLCHFHFRELHDKKNTVFFHT